MPTLIIYPVGAGVGGPCNAVAHDADHFLTMFDREFPLDYLYVKKTTPNGGYELFRGFAAVGERLSTAIKNLECGSLIIFAEGGALATGEVVFSRPTDAAGAVTVVAGTRVTTSRGGLDFITTADAVFGGTDLSVTAPVAAVAPGWEWNVRGSMVTALGETIPGEIDTVSAFVQSPPFGDPTIVVSQVSDCAGGRDPMLDGLGADRLVFRAAGESDEQYRYRIRILPDTVSPGAIERMVASRLQPFNLSHQHIETWDVRYQTCWDAPNQTYTGAGAGYDPNLFTYDDPRDPTPFRNRWLDEIEARGAFIIVVPALATIRDVGMAYDDTGVIPADFTAASTGGLRASSAYDVPSDFSAGLAGGFDGFDLPHDAVYRGIWESMQQIKAAGVAAIIELEGQ